MHYRYTMQIKAKLNKVACLDTFNCLFVQDLREYNSFGYVAFPHFIYSVDAGKSYKRKIDDDCINYVSDLFTVFLLLPIVL